MYHTTLPHTILSNPELEENLDKLLYSHGYNYFKNKSEVFSISIYGAVV